MRLAYAFARRSASSSQPVTVLDCGSGQGRERIQTFGRCRGDNFRYLGLEWNDEEVRLGQEADLHIVQADLNRRLPVESSAMDCVIAYSVLEHLLMPCSFLIECQRVLKPGGRLVLLTPNISTYFTAVQILAGGMPSSGPHPDSNWLIDAEAPVKVSDIERGDVATDTPQHRHLVVFSFKVLRRFLEGVGFSIVEARGFGYYPLPLYLQNIMEELDPGHCHQMVFVCEKR